MSFAAFVDEYPPPKVMSFLWGSAPRWSTDITTVKSGASARNQNWTSPLMRFTAPQGIRSQEDFEPVKDMWMALGGPAMCFPMRDPLDFASTYLPFADFEPEITAVDQAIGVGDGNTSAFQITKAYRFGTAQLLRPIWLPVVTTVVVAINGHDPGDGTDGGPYTWGVSRPGGVVQFDQPVMSGAVVSAGYLYDVQARFEADDTFEGIVNSYKIAGFADLSFVEERGC